MTAGQRNCHIAIENCLDSYGFDDVFFALQEHIREWDGGGIERARELAASALNSLSVPREYMVVAQAIARKEVRA